MWQPSELKLASNNGNTNSWLALLECIGKPTLEVEKHGIHCCYKFYLATNN